MANSTDRQRTSANEKSIVLEESFYLDKDVTRVARGLLGKTLVTRINGVVTAGVIVETEAYSHIEKGCHAYLNKVTPRNRVMLNPGGHAYVYLCYGIHNLFNVVTNVEGLGDAVLIRALEPTRGMNAMLKRMSAKAIERITSGPGKLTKAMGIDRDLNGQHLTGRYVWIENGGVEVRRSEIDVSKRIGIDYAGADADRPWRFKIKSSKWVSR